MNGSEKIVRNSFRLKIRQFKGIKSQGFGPGLIAGKGAEGGPVVICAVIGSLMFSGVRQCLTDRNQHLSNSSLGQPFSDSGL